MMETSKMRWGRWWEVGGGGGGRWEVEVGGGGRGWEGVGGGRYINYTIPAWLKLGSSDYY